MIHSQGTKKVVVFAPQSVATNATAAGNIDTRGYSHCVVDVILDSAGAVSSNPSVCKLTESDDTVVSNFVAITEFTGDGAGGWTIPNADTASPQVVVFDVDCSAKRKRYLKLSVTPAGAAQLMSAVATLDRAQEIPDSDTERGAAEVVYG